MEPERSYCSDVCTIFARPLSTIETVKNKVASLNVTFVPILSVVPVVRDTVLIKDKVKAVP